MDTSRIPLLESKLRMPRRRAGVVRRERLTRQFDPLHLPALTLVSAPAGFGKTTLVTEWLTEGPSAGPVAWLSLDHRDSDPALYWAYVVASLGKVEPGIGDDALAVLQATPQRLDAVVASLLNDLSALERDVVLVLDDYHLVESLAVQESMQFLLDHQPSQLRLVVASRADPPWPLAGLRARGDLLEIRAANLRFTAEEATAYLNDAMGLDLASTDIDALAGRTEGWVAALQLAALSLQGRGDPSGFITDFTGDDRFVVDYLVDEVLDRQPADIRSFLLETSILNRLSAGLCAAVTGRSDAKAVLEAVERSNLFLVALDDRRRWYRYHHLFADVIRARLSEEDTAAIPELHRRASAWYQANGDEAEAITHAIAAADFEQAAQLVELATPVLRRRRQESTLRRWLEALPDDIFADRPVLAISLVGARMATGDSTGVEALLDTVESRLDATGTAPIVFDDHEFAGLAAQVLIYRAGLGLLSGDADATITNAHAALDLVEPTDDLRRGSAAGLLALAHWTTGDLDAAESQYAAAISALIAAHHLTDALGCSIALADIRITRGRLTDAAHTLDAGLRLTAEHPGLRGAADMHVGLSEVLIERNQLDAAARHLATSAALGDSAGLPQHPYRRRVAMARLCRARGELDRALALVDEAIPLYDTDYSPPVRPVGAIRARAQLALGDLDAATAWAAARGLGVADDVSYVREYEHVTLARTILACQAAGRDADLDGAIGLLDRLLAAADGGSRTGSAIEILVLQAVAQNARADRPATLTALDEALRRAEQEGHVRLFLHAGPELTALLRSIALRKDAPAHVRKVLAAVDPTTNPTLRRPSPTSYPVEELSARELDVLRLLRSELSGPDIARELVVSINTVRSHTKSIYMKLGVNSRRAAIRRADELGL